MSACTKRGWIYRGARMINWDPSAKTALSDEEVEYKEVQGKLYYVKYFITVDSSQLKVDGKNTVNRQLSTDNYINYRQRNALKPSWAILPFA